MWHTFITPFAFLNINQTKNNSKLRARTWQPCKNWVFVQAYAKIKSRHTCVWHRMNNFDYVMEHRKTFDCYSRLHNLSESYLGELQKHTVQVWSLKTMTFWVNVRDCLPCSQARKSRSLKYMAWNENKWCSMIMFVLGKSCDTKYKTQRCFQGIVHKDLLRFIETKTCASEMTKSMQ